MNTSKTELSMNELETANGGGLISNRFNPYNTPVSNFRSGKTRNNQEHN